MAKSDQELILEIKADISDIKKDFKNIGKEAQNAGQDAQGGFQPMGNMMNGIKTAGIAAFAAIGAAATAALVGVVKSVADTEQAMTELKYATGATEKEMANYKASIEAVKKTGLASDTKEIAKELQSYGQIVGGVTEDTATFIETTKRISGGEAEAKDIAKAVHSLQKNFKGLSEEQAFDIINNGLGSAANKSGDFLDSVNEYSVQFSKAGYSAADMYAKLKAGADAGAWSVDAVGDMIKEQNIRFKEDSKTTSDAYKALGLDAKKYAEMSSKGGKHTAKAFKDVMEKLQGIKDESKKNEIATDLLGTKYEDLQMNVAMAVNAAEGDMKSLEGKTREAADGMKDTLNSKMAAIKNQMWGAFKDGSPLNGHLKDLADWVLSNMPAIQATIGKFFTYMKEGFVFLRDMVFIPLKNLFTQNKSHISTTMQQIFSVISSVWGAIVSIIRAVVTLLVGIWQSWGEQLLAVIRPAFNIIVSIVKTAMNIIKEVFNFFTALFKGDWKGMGEALKNIWLNLWSMIQEIVENYKKYIVAVVKLFGKILLGVWNWIKKLALGAWEGIKKGVIILAKAMKEKVVEWVTKLKDMMLEKIRENKEKTIAFWSELWETLKQTIIDFKSMILGKVEDFVQGIIDKFNFVSDAWGWGYDLIMGLWDGISSMGSWIKSKVSNFMEGITSTVKGVLGIHSPSRVFRDEVGKQMVAGLNAGVDKEKKKTEKNLAKFGQDATNAFKKSMGDLNTSAGVSFSVNKSSLNNAVSNAAASVSHSMKAETKRKSTVNVKLEGDLANLVDKVETTINDNLNNMSGGRLI